jgi:hypothetical protein
VIRLVFVLAAAIVVASLVLTFGASILRAAAKRLPKPAPRESRPKVRYDWEPRQDRLKRKIKGIHFSDENRDAMLRFLDTRAGVEAYVEPRTVVSPLSVVLVARDGEWQRFPLADDGFLRELARSRGLAIHDAMREGYPERMRRYRRTGSPERSLPEDGSTPDPPSPSPDE